MILVDSITFPISQSHFMVFRHNEQVSDYRYAVKKNIFKETFYVFFYILYTKKLYF